MAGNDCWGAFGSDSDDDSDDDNNNGDIGEQNNNTFGPVVDAVSLSITQHFSSLTKSTGVLLKDRVVGLGIYTNDDTQLERWQNIMMERIDGRGMKVVQNTESCELLQCDAAIISWRRGLDATTGGNMKRALIPGGFLWLIIACEDGDNGGDISMQTRLKDYPNSIWDVDSASVIYSSIDFQVISLQKRACLINAWSCPWMDKQQRIRSHIDKNDEFPVSETDTYLQYERRVADRVTISPSVAERNGEHGVTVLTDTNIQRATEILQKHGLVVIKGLLPPSQIRPWGKAVLSDFNSAVSRLKCHPTRPVDLMNPHTADATDEHIFEPLSYKEMAMREDLRVDLRSGPEMEALRRSENEVAYTAMASKAPKEGSNASTRNDGPTIVDSGTMGTTQSWRFHPSIIAIIKSIFNPKDIALSKGNFGRWNFSGDGPNGSPQSFRLGQIGSVLSCPGSADQAIHADTPHLFEHVDCLPCHYLNVFTPGYDVVNDSTNDYFQNEFHDGIWTGNSTIGGTAFVHGSHRLSVTAQLLSDDDTTIDVDVSDENGEEVDTALIRKLLLQLRTLRPALDQGDVIFFDCRTIHYGLANTSQGDTTGKYVDAGRRPMLYLNVSQSWFHDPKNWDERAKIFD